MYGVSLTSLFSCTPKAMVLCFKLYFIKDATICTTAAATVRQMVSVIFERVVTEDSQGLGKEISVNT